MIYLFLILVCYLLGRGSLRVLYGKSMRREFDVADSLLTGFMVVIGLAAAVNIGGAVLGRSFSDCVLLFMTGLVVLLLISAILILAGQYKMRHDDLYAGEAQRLRIKKAMTGQGMEAKEIILFLVFGLMVLLQVLLMAKEQRLYLTGDMTVETVNTILATDTVGQVNPLTGRAYELGMPLRLKILSLPMLYAILCSTFGLSAVELVWGMIPVLVLLGSYCAFYAVGKALFPRERMKRGYFLVLVALFLWVGDYMYGMDGFGVQYAGYRGLSIRATILIPYTICMMIRKRWKVTVLCVLAEACIVWTLYGMGVCFFIALGMAIVNWILGRKMQSSGKEDDL
jgi:hypothetical protein